jgi:hypothetical protein
MYEVPMKRLTRINRNNNKTAKQLSRLSNRQVLAVQSLFNDSLWFLVPIRLYFTTDFGRVSLSSVVSTYMAPIYMYLCFAETYAGPI